MASFSTNDYCTDIFLAKDNDDVFFVLCYTSIDQSKKYFCARWLFKKLCNDIIESNRKTERKVL